MKLDVLLPLAYLSYYRHSFFSVDMIVFLLICLVFYHITYKQLPQKSSLLDETMMKKYKMLRALLVRLLILQLICVFSLWLWVISQKPLLVHAQAGIGFFGYIFVFIVILRIVNIMLMIGFLITYRSLLDEDITVKRLSYVLCILLLFYTFQLFYLLFPTLNRALTVYEMFYNIRNLVITNDPNKKQKTIAYLRQMECIPSRFYPLYKQEWARTFKNQPVHLEWC